MRDTIVPLLLLLCVTLSVLLASRVFADGPNAQDQQ